MSSDDYVSPPGFERADKHMKRQMQRPGMAGAVAEIRSEMRVADHRHAFGVAAIRQAAHMTQKDLARELGVDQSVVSRTENGSDMLLSTLAKYLRATGVDDAAVSVRVRGSEVRLSLFEAFCAIENEGAETDEAGKATDAASAPRS